MCRGHGRWKTEGHDDEEDEDRDVDVDVDIDGDVEAAAASGGSLPLPVHEHSPETTNGKRDRNGLTEDEDVEENQDVRAVTFMLLAAAACLLFLPPDILGPIRPHPLPPLPVPTPRPCTTSGRNGYAGGNDTTMRRTRLLPGLPSLLRELFLLLLLLLHA